jgi:hypothetical protein
MRVLFDNGTPRGAGLESPFRYHTSSSRETQKESVLRGQRRVAVQFVITVMGGGKAACSSSTTLTRNRWPSAVTS